MDRCCSGMAVVCESRQRIVELEQTLEKVTQENEKLSDLIERRDMQVTDWPFSLHSNQRLLVFLEKFSFAMGLCLCLSVCHKSVFYQNS